jgi:CRP/FNR family transcriptional regulator, cyclic AMP receptor protein
LGQFELIDLGSKADPRPEGAARPPRRTNPTLNEMLRSSRWAGSLTNEELDRACRETYERCVRAGDVFVRAGTVADFWVGVIEGMAKMSVSLPNGRESTFTAVSAGGWFGEGTLMKSECWRYDAIAVRDSRLACMPRATFQRLLNTSLRFSHSVMTLMNARLSQFIGLAVFDRLLSADTRVARCLASLFNSDLYPSASSFVKLSQDEIGLLSAVSRQRTNRALHALQDAGLLRVEFGGVTVLDVPGLWRFSGDPEVREVPKRRIPLPPSSPHDTGAEVGAVTASSKLPL